MSSTPLLTLALLVALCLTTTDANAQVSASTCGSDDDRKVIQNYYSNVRPGSPPPAAGRLFRMPEATVVSSLHPDHAYGVRSNLLFFFDVWKSIDTWGADTKIGVVFTSGGMHAWNFPSTVPQTQASTSPMWYDMYADDGAGVHGHITPQEVDQIWALQIPTVRPDRFTRILAFYDKEGDLIVGLYVSENVKDFDPAAVAGFERTRELLRTQPRICSPG